MDFYDNQRKYFIKDFGYCGVGVIVWFGILFSIASLFVFVIAGFRFPLIQVLNPTLYTSKMFDDAFYFVCLFTLTFSLPCSMVLSCGDYTHFKKFTSSSQFRYYTYGMLLPGCLIFIILSWKLVVLLNELYESNVFISPDYFVLVYLFLTFTLLVITFVTYSEFHTAEIWLELEKEEKQRFRETHQEVVIDNILHGVKMAIEKKMESMIEECLQFGMSEEEVADFLVHDKDFNRLYDNFDFLFYKK